MNGLGLESARVNNVSVLSVPNLLPEKYYMQGIMQKRRFSRRHMSVMPY